MTHAFSLYKLVDTDLGSLLAIDPDSSMAMMIGPCPCGDRGDLIRRMLDPSLLLLKRNACEAPTDGGDLSQFRRMAYLLGDDEFLFCRERISPARAVLCSEIGVVTSAESIDRGVGLAGLGHRFGQT